MNIGRCITISFRFGISSAVIAVIATTIFVALELTPSAEIGWAAIAAIIWGVPGSLIFALGILVSAKLFGVTADSDTINKRIGTIFAVLAILWGLIVAFGSISRFYAF